MEKLLALPLQEIDRRLKIWRRMESNEQDMAIAGTLIPEVIKLLTEARKKKLETKES